MKKYYPYSVKSELENYFTGDTVTEMRIVDDEHSEEARKHIIPLAWAYADRCARGVFLTDLFLRETLLYDDYVVYVLEDYSRSYAYLSFLHFEDNVSFDLDPQYAYGLCREWEAKGYCARIMRNCIGIEKSKDGFRFVTHGYKGMGSEAMIPIAVNGDYVFVRDKIPFWLHANAALYSAVCSGLYSKYESILSADAVLSRCYSRGSALEDHPNTQRLAKGIGKIKRYFEGMLLPSMVYLKGGDESCYDIRIVADNRSLVLYVDSSNQITEIVETPIKETDDLIPIPADMLPTEILAPRLTQVRTLDIVAVHAFGIRVGFSDGCVKNYYIKSFDTADIPEFIDVNGYRFSAKELSSARLVENNGVNGVAFSNGYYIPEHILYYRGRTQLIPEKLDKEILTKDGIRLTGTYASPLHIMRGGPLCFTKFPRDDEYYGASSSFVDCCGNRTGDYSARSIDLDGKDVFATRSDANNKVGYLKEDGTWLVPPIFDEGGDFEWDHCVSACIGDKKYLVNVLGEIIPFDHRIDLRNFANGLCEFSVQEYNGKCEYPEEEYFDELHPGLWGFIDKLGRIAIEPRYVFTSGFRWIKGRAFVAKIVDGQTLWGLIDEKGNEVIPCVYTNLATHSGAAVNFQRERYGAYGIMDRDGNVIMEPRYRGICGYDEEHGLVAAFHKWDKQGVARISDGKVIVPFEYGCIGFEDGYIEGETEAYECHCYDYNGNRLPNDYTSGWEHNGNRAMWENGKCGVISANGDVIVPFILDAARYIDYYERGYVVTGIKGKRGLSTVDGKVILQEKYTDVIMQDDFVIGTYCTEGGWEVRCELCLTDGTLVFDDVYRKVKISGNELTRETPRGVEHYRIERP